MQAGAHAVIATREEPLYQRLQEHTGGPEDTPYPLKLALKKSLTLRGYVYTEVTQNPDCLARAQTFIADGIASGTLRPHIDSAFTLDEVVETHRYLEWNQQFGKVILTT